MLDFSVMTLADAPKLRPYLTHTYSRLCDYVFGTLVFWRDMWPLEYAISDDIVFLRLEISKNQFAFMLPVGSRSDFDLVNALGMLDSYFNACGTGNMLYYNVPLPEADILKKHYGNVTVEPISSGGDYIYDALSMAELSGRKLHGQRNHFNYFERTYDYHLTKITAENVGDVKIFVESKAVDASSELFKEGTRKTFELFDNLDIYDFSSLALYVDDKVVGFTFGSLLDDTLYVILEQADRDHRGAYPKLASAFVYAHLDAGAVYVNREDDLGNAGLRRSKLAWNPVEIVERYSVRIDR